MPIITRTLEHIRLQADGRVKAQERLVDHNGRAWLHNVRGASQAVLETAMNARDMSAQLANREEADAIEHTIATGDPDTFPRTELTLNELRRRLAKRFAQALMNDDRKFLCAIAGYIQQFTATQIANVLNISEAKAQKIIDRAATMTGAGGICADLDTDDAAIEEDIP